VVVRVVNWLVEVPISVLDVLLSEIALVAESPMMIVIDWGLTRRLKRLVTGSNIPENVVRHLILAALTARNPL